MSNLPAVNGDLEMPELPTTRSSINLLQIIWQRKSLVVLGVIIGLVLGSLYSAQRAPTYLSTASVLVVKRTPDALAGGATQYMIMEDYMTTQTTILRSMEVALRAAKDKEIKDLLDKGELKSFAASNEHDLAYEIMGALTVGRDTKDNPNSQQGGSNVILLAFKGPDAHECQKFLEAVIRSYQKFLDEKYKSQSDALMASINEAKSKLETDVTKATDALFLHRQSADDVSTHKRDKGTSALQKEYDAITNEIAGGKMRLAACLRDYDHFKKIYDDEGAQVTISYLVTAGYKNIFNGDSDIERELARLQLRREELLGRYREKHPDVVAIDKAIEAMRNKYFKRKSDESGKPLHEVEKDAAMQFVNGLKSESERLQRLVTENELALDNLKLKMRRSDAWDMKDESLQRSVQHQEALFAAVVQKIQTIDMTKGGGFEATAITRAGIGRKIAPIPFQVFTAATLLGALLGIGLAYLAEISDKSFRNPTEIRRRLGLPVIGHVPYLAADEKAQELVANGTATVDPMLITHYQSGSIGAEAYRGVRTALYFSTRGENHKVIQVTSPNVSDGKSTLAANLAASIAQSGKRHAAHRRGLPQAARSQDFQCARTNRHGLGHGRTVRSCQCDSTNRGAEPLGAPVRPSPSESFRVAHKSAVQRVARRIANAV